MQENGASSFQGDANDGQKPSKDKTMRKREDCCKHFEEQIVDEFLDQLKINKGNLTDPNIGPIPKSLSDAGTVTSIVLGVASVTTLGLSIGTFGIGSLVGAAVAGITFTVTKLDQRKKKANAKTLDEKMEIYVHSELKCIIRDVARELSRMFEYQVVELEDETQINLLAKCAVDLMLSKWKENENLGRNTLIKKVLQDGKLKKTELLTREGDKWFAPDVFRQPGLRKMIFEKDGAEFEYFVKKANKKAKNACDTSKYGYRGQFLELKNDETKKLKNEEDDMGKDETDAVKDCLYCNESFIESSHNENSQHENCTIYHQYFCESVIDSHYTERRVPCLTYNPIHILIRCPNVLESFNQLREEKPSLAKFLKKTFKKVLPEDHLVLPIYRPHLPKKITNLEKSDLTGSDFSHSDFTNSSLEGCTFTEVVMLFAELAGTRMSGSKFNDTLISHSNLVGVKARKCKWTKTKLLYSRVEGAYLDGAESSISGNTLIGTNIGEAHV
ncbi:Hypothetical predicted protein [Paramuricea clavata]|uniref:Uncharacterized protein n=1 Tax=Paramuricea clavata TaxID=317549 RepID=A0A7D9K653_PARCT|nr:Hypothetical predicted protein [Paramuricea clavata]